MRRPFRFVASTVIGLSMVAGSSAAAPADKPLDWHDLMTVARSHPKTDLHWGTGKAQILAQHPQSQNVGSPFPPNGPGFFFAESVTDGACSFVVQARSDHSDVLSALILELPRTAPPDCGKKWLAALQTLYGKPVSSGPVQDLIVDADTAIQTLWSTPTSCIRSTYTRADAPHPGPFTVVFGDKQAGACGYDDQAAFVNRRKK